MKVLLTGSFGNIGSHAVSAILQAGHRLRCFDLPSPAHDRAARRAMEDASRVDGAADRLEFQFGDIRDGNAVARAVSGIDVVLHLAAVIPPACNENPAAAREVNIGGTRTLIDACRALPRPPRLLFTSSLDVFGYTQSKAPPRRADEPVSASDPYTEHKLECEELVRRSSLDWCIFRFSDVPIIGLRPAHPIMFEIGLHNRIEALHAADAALALVRAIDTEEVWGRLLLVGGGPRCQVTYGEYLRRLLNAMGVGMLPEEAFSETEYVTDWLDSRDAEQLLHYQRHSFDDIVSDIAACLGLRRLFVPLARPFVRRSILSMSPYYAGRTVR